jgi:hypothetical protein
MSGVAKVIGQIAAVVAVVAGIAAMFVPGGQILGISLLTISAVAGAVAGVANAVAAATQKPPDAKGSTNQVVIGANMPAPYNMGRTFFAGMQVYDDSNGTNNVDRTQIYVGSVGGSVDSFESFQLDFNAIPFSASSGGLIKGKATDAWYGDGAGFLFLDSRLGLLPDTALTPYSGRAAFRDWDSSSKLSGMACWSMTMAFDKKGERWSGGIGAPGMVAKWVRVYDPRLDSTYPGGSGSQRQADETTWTWSDNPGLHALAYAFGRHENGEKVVGIGYRPDQIRIARFVEFANQCDANGWKLGGTIFEGPGISKWNNLKSICAAGAAMPVWSGGILDLKLSKPVIPLDRVTKDDLAGGSVAVPAMKRWRERWNTIIPRYRSEPHRWDYVELLEPVVEPTYLLEDGESKTDTRQYDLVQDNGDGAGANQAAQMARYGLVNEREFGPIPLVLKPRFRPYRLGESLMLDMASLYDDDELVDQPAVIVGRQSNPADGTVTLTFESETPAKHPWALAGTGTAPPSPTIRTNAEIDGAANLLTLTETDIQNLIVLSAMTGLTFSVGIPSGGNSAVTISAHDRVYSDKTVSVNGNGGPISVAAASGDIIAAYYDDPDRLGGAVTYHYLVLSGGTGDLSPAFPSPSNPYRHNVFVFTVPTSGGTTGGGSDAGSGGGSGGGRWELDRGNL